MRVKLVVRLALFAALACSTGCSNNKGKIEGTKWSSEEATIKETTVPAGTLAMDFSPDGKLAYTVGPATFAGTYELKRGDTVLLNFDQEVSGRTKQGFQIV